MVKQSVLHPASPTEPTDSRKPLRLGDHESTIDYSGYQTDHAEYADWAACEVQTAGNAAALRPTEFEKPSQPQSLESKLDDGYESAEAPYIGWGVYDVSKTGKSTSSGFGDDSAYGGSSTMSEVGPEGRDLEAVAESHSTLPTYSGQVRWKCGFPGCVASFQTKYLLK